jgi:hypothetical protein
MTLLTLSRKYTKVLELYESGYDFTGGIWLVKGQIMPAAETATKEAVSQREFM